MLNRLRDLIFPKREETPTRQEPSASELRMWQRADRQKAPKKRRPVKRAKR